MSVFGLSKAVLSMFFSDKGMGLLVQDYGQLIRTHRETGADVTICTNSVGWDMAPRRGLARVNPENGGSRAGGATSLGSLLAKCQCPLLRARACGRMHYTPARNHRLNDSMCGWRVLW